MHPSPCRYPRLTVASTATAETLKLNCRTPLADSAREIRSQIWLKWRTIRSKFSQFVHGKIKHVTFQANSSEILDDRPGGDVLW